MERLWYLWLFFLCNGMVLATDSCARTVQANVDEEGDDVMLLAMPQRPRPTRKQRSRDADGDATSLFQVDEVSMPSAIVRVDSDETLMSHSWILVFVSVFLFVLLGMCALQNSKEDGNRELQTLVSRLSVKSAEELLNQFAPKESPKDPSMQKLGITRIQGRVVAKNAQTMATPFSDQQCVMYSASASQKRQDGVHQPPLAYHAACSDFAIELEGPTPLQISVHGHDVSLFQMSQGRFCKEASFSGYSLLPNHEYELSVSSRNPSSIYGSSRWGVLLRDAARQVLEANMEIPSYNLSDFGFELLSLQPSTSAPNASNEVRLQLRFQKQLLLGQPISEIRIEAPKAWDFQPLCNLYQDITGGCETRCSVQLPYAEERGHHLCEGNVLILVLDTFGVIDVTAFVLLFSVVNPAEAPSQNFWSVSLANSFDLQRVKYTELLTPGFFIGNRQSFLPAL